MGAAAYNRGSRLVIREVDERLAGVSMRADQYARETDVARLHAQIATLERDLRRARRCLAAERAGREALRVRLAHEETAYAFAVGVLCRLAFPRDESES
jgi:outer membrane murein-binding lipoprotein Lpp